VDLDVRSGVKYSAVIEGCRSSSPESNVVYTRLRVAARRYADFWQVASKARRLKE